MFTYLIVGCLCLQVPGEVNEPRQIGEDQFATSEARPVGLKIEPHGKSAFRVGIVCWQKQSPSLKALAVKVANTSATPPPEGEAFRMETVIWYLHRDLARGLSLYKDGQHFTSAPLLPPRLRELEESVTDFAKREGWYVARYDDETLPSSKEIEKTLVILKELLELRFDVAEDERVEVKLDDTFMGGYPLSLRWEIVKAK